MNNIDFQLIFGVVECYYILFVEKLFLLTQILMNNYMIKLQINNFSSKDKHGKPKVNK